MFDDEELRRRAAVEQLIAAIRQGGVAGARIGPDGTVIAGEPGWEERTKDQRLSEKAKTHGWPPGLAKSMRWRRDRLVAEHRDRADLSRDETIEALAWRWTPNGFSARSAGVRRVRFRRARPMR